MGTRQKSKPIKHRDQLPRVRQSANQALLVAIEDRLEVSRGDVLGLLLLVTASLCRFLFFYPIYTSLPLSPHAFGLRMWLPGWR